MTDQPEASNKPDAPQPRPKRRRLSYREKIRQRNRRQREHAIDNRPKPRRDAAVEMVRGTALQGRLDDPSHNPLWLSLAEHDERQRVRSQVDAWDNNSLP